METLNRSIRIVESAETKTRNNILLALIVIFLVLIFYTLFRSFIGGPAHYQSELRQTLVRIEAMEKQMAENYEKVIVVQKALYQQRGDMAKKIEKLRSELDATQMTREEMERIKNEVMLVSTQIDYINRFNQGAVESLSSMKEEVEQLKSQMKSRI